MTESTLPWRLRQNRSWILLLLLLLFVVGILAVDTLISKYLNPSFNCEASLINPGKAEGPRGDEKLRLGITTENGQTRLKVSYRYDNEPWAGIELAGTIEGVELGSLSYLMSLEPYQDKLLLGEEELPPYLMAMREAINKALAQSGKLELRLHVLEMDILADYSLIQLSPGNHLWACRMTEFEEEDESQMPLINESNGIWDW